MAREEYDSVDSLAPIVANHRHFLAMLETQSANKFAPILEEGGLDVLFTRGKYRRVLPPPWCRLVKSSAASIEFKFDISLEVHCAEIDREIDVLERGERR